MHCKVLRYNHTSTHSAICVVAILGIPLNPNNCQVCAAMLVD